MRIAIMADTADNFVKPRAEGLHRMLNQIGISSTVFYDGLFFLDHKLPETKIRFSGAKDLVKSVIHAVNPPLKARFNARGFADQSW